VSNSRLFIYLCNGEISKGLKSYDEPKELDLNLGMYGKTLIINNVLKTSKPIPSLLCKYKVKTTAKKKLCS
jgi:hypothetical protein